MFEYQGWATIRATDSNSERTDEFGLSESFEQRLVELVDNLNCPSNMIAMRLFQNGSDRLYFFGDRNHADAVMPTVHKVFSLLSNEAPGSYGEFSCIDWEEDRTTEYWILRRGKIIREPHPHFNPMVQSLEGPDEADL